MKKHVYTLTAVSACADCITSNTVLVTIPGCCPSAASRANNDSSCSDSGLFSMYSSVSRLRAETGGQFPMATASFIRSSVDARDRVQETMQTENELTLFLVVNKVFLLLYIRCV